MANLESVVSVQARDASVFFFLAKPVFSRVQKFESSLLAGAHGHASVPETFLRQVMQMSDRICLFQVPIRARASRFENSEV